MSDKGIVTAMAASAAIVVASRWTQSKPLDAKVGLGALFATVALSVIDSYAPVVAKGLAAIILVTTIIVDGPPVFAAVNNVSSAPLAGNPNTKLGPK
jgi:hypothetical protein